MKNKLILYSKKGLNAQYFGPGVSAGKIYKHISKKQKVFLLHSSILQTKKGLPFDMKGYYGKNLFYLVFFLLFKFSYKQDKYVAHLLGGYWDSVIIALILRFKNIDCYIKITGIESIQRKKKFQWILRLKLLKYLKYISINSDIKKILMKNGVCENNIFLINNPVNIPTFQLNSYKKNIIFCGSISKNKNVHLIYELAKCNKDYFFDIVGPVTDEDYFNTFKKEIGNLRFHGFQKDPSKFYTKSSIVMLLSDNEGSPNSILEGMSYGLVPIVSLSSNSIVINKKNGIIVADITDQNELRNAMDFVERNYHTLSLNSFKFVSENHESKSISDLHLKLFNNGQI